LREILEQTGDFRSDGKKRTAGFFYSCRGIEQNPPTSKTQTSLLAGCKYPHPWAKMAKAGKKVTQFVEGRKCVAVVVDEKRYMLTFSGDKIAALRCCEDLGT
jgi:hypothetical protein